MEIYMNNFWNNIRRYPNFLISSFLGLIVVMLNSFQGLLKTPKLRLIVILFSLFSLLTVYIIVKTMLAL